MKLKYPDPHLHFVSLTCIIHRAGKYLITKRSPSEKAFPNMWTVPGGKVSVDDYINTPRTTDPAWYKALEVSLKREIKEEVNLEISNLRYLINMTFIRPDKVPVVVLSFYANYKSGKVKLDDDAVDFKWVTAKEAGEYNLISGIYEEIVMADKIIRGADPNKVKIKFNK
ncbi:NUDIX domain-containing protein [Candidatus Woesebacteria bacterium]|nr:NUDIX domain-containing protein [Candidatus Woesebacteria bacterium]